MRIRLLGTAAGGGVPQWNCNCLICREARGGTGRVKPRTQSCVAISADDQHWFLLNASPDLRVQIETFSSLHPVEGNPRGSPIQAVLLTNADLDHTLGLFQLREGKKLRIHASASVRKSLTDHLLLASTMSTFLDLEWVEPPTSPTPLRDRGNNESGLLYHAIPLTGHAPRFSRSANGGSVHVIGYQFTDEATNGRLLFLPDVATLDDQVKDASTDCDALLIDGTFWSDEEMIQCGASTLSASEMGHLPISGANESPAARTVARSGESSSKMGFVLLM